jgi:hypothetical protein
MVKNRLTLELVPPFTIPGVTGMSSEKSFYRSGELAELAGVSTDTLRHYERKGVLVRPLRRKMIIVNIQQLPCNAYDSSAAPWGLALRWTNWP